VKTFGICQQKQLTLLFSRANFFELRAKALHSVQPRNENFWNCDEKDCILFSRAAIFFELALV
jgi:hypothetical protein